jgi:hypothetical protein
LISGCPSPAPLRLRETARNREFEEARASGPASAVARR